MLERIHIENYKCLRDVTVELGDFTVLIGPNDSGKSSFLEVVKIFGQIAGQRAKPPHRPNVPFQGDRSPKNVVWLKDASREIVLDVTGAASSSRFHYRLDLPVDERPQRESLEWDGRELLSASVGTAGNLPAAIGGQPTLPAQKRQFQLQQFVSRGMGSARTREAQEIQEALASSLEYRFEPRLLPNASVPKPGEQLEPTGGNLAAVLDVMQNSADRTAFQAVEEALHKAIPNISGIVLPPASQSGRQAGAKALRFVLSGNGKPRVTIPGSLASDGALLLTAFLTLAHTETPGVLLFEEPENGLHPFRLQMVVDLLRAMSRGETGNRKRQIILTTHNPLLLNYARPEEVRIFVREPDKGTQVHRMSDVPDIDRLLKEFSLGELWYLFGEQKLIQEQSA